MDKHTFEIDRDAVVRWKKVSLIANALPLFLIGGLVVWPLLKLGGQKIVTDWSNALDYRVEDDVLRACSELKVGTFVLSRTDKAIPLRRITDVKLVQGPILSHMNLWQLQIQTAGQGMIRAEATLHGLRDPDQARQLILDRVRTTYETK